MFLRLIVLLLFLSGCASVVRLPASTGQVPVVGGEFLKGRIGIDASNAIPVTTINDPTTNPPTRTRILVGEEESFAEILVPYYLLGSGWDANLGLLKRLDIYYTRNFGIRFMVLGEPRAQGWRATLFAGYVNSSQTENFENGVSTSVKTKISGVEYGVSIGNKFSDSNLGYLTLASRGGDANIKVEQTAVGTFEYEDEFDHYIASLGLMVGDSFYGKIEVSANLIRWQGTNSISLQPIEDEGVEFGGSIGFGYIW